MGLLDDKCIEYFDSPSRFADVMNFTLYGGKKIIKPSELEEADSVTVKSGTAGRKNGKFGTGKRSAGGKRVIADKVKRWKGACLRILVQEYQSYVDLTMPVRCMLGDALRYSRQCENIKQDHYRARNLKAGDEYLSGTKAGEKIAPVVTVVINLSEKKWYGPRSLFEMFDEKERGFAREFISDHRINILDYHDVVSFDKMGTEVRQVFEVLKVRNSDKKLKRLVKKDAAYSHLDDDTADFLEILADIRIAPDEKGERNMCKAIQMERAKGRAEGLKAGKKKGVRKGIKKGLRRGTAEINALNQILISQDRMEDLKRATADREYQKRLMAELLPSRR